MNSGSQAGQNSALSHHPGYIEMRSQASSLAQEVDFRGNSLPSFPDKSGLAQNRGNFFSAAVCAIQGNKKSFNNTNEQLLGLKTNSRAHSKPLGSSSSLPEIMEGK